LRSALAAFSQWHSKTRDFSTRFEVVMGSECAICSKKPVRGNQKVERGKAKYLGGNGRKTTGITKRWFRPNLQSLRMQDGETSKRVRVCVQCLRSGLVVKRVVKKPFTIEG
jgi:large subunit ribosomal protein L28